MIKRYTIEVEGQKDFYASYLPLVDRTMTLDDILSDNTDGVLNGNLLEFKLNINDLNAVLFQAIKYLSAMRINGKPIPANIVLISLNDASAYYYRSADYLEDIEKLYLGSASRNNAGFQGSSPIETLKYVEDMADEARLIHLLREKKYTKINIDEDCIVGWATSYYKKYPQARKADFIGDISGKVKIIGEIRQPDKFKDYLYPYTGQTNGKFHYLMDKLNDVLQQKNLGAFYTPDLYAKKSLELVREAIARVPEGNDYIILDRCAGTGNLEMNLTDEELSHAILSTVEYYEYKVLIEFLGDKVRHIVPPTEKEDTFNMGLVRGADALSEEYINNPVIKSYLENPAVTIILFENPPYAETTSIEHQKKKEGKASSGWKNNFVVQEMKKNISGTASNDMGNAFIWSAFKYYLRQPTDSYIVYSPVKYWKVQHLIHKNFIRGFAFNRRHFHTKIDATIMCALWSNEDNHKLEHIELEASNIVNDELFDEGIINVKRIHKTYSKQYFDKRKMSEDADDGIFIELDGTERLDKTKGVRIVPTYNENIVGYLAVYSSGFDNPDLHASLLIAGRYDGNGFFLRKDNYIEKLPMFAASRYITYNRKWTERARVMKSGDGSVAFERDIKSGKLQSYLQKVLLFTCLETQNHMRTFTGSDGRAYKNELCLDDSNGETIAMHDLNGMEQNQDEEFLIKQWQYVLQSAKKTENYNPSLTYGVYQIQSELNTTHLEGELNKKVYDYPELNGHLATLKALVKNYYLNEIVPTLFEYEFLK